MEGLCRGIYSYQGTPHNDKPKHTRTENSNATMHKCIVTQYEYPQPLLSDVPTKCLEDKVGVVKAPGFVTTKSFCFP